MGTKADIISDIRGFNRFYTNILGLLDKHVLQSEYSLTEARILFELNETGMTTANALCASLSIDKSYMSRMLSGFEKKGLIQKEVSQDDSRAYSIWLSEKGQRCHARTWAKNPASSLRSCLRRFQMRIAGKFTPPCEQFKRTCHKRRPHASFAPFRQEDVDFNHIGARSGCTKRNTASPRISGKATCGMAYISWWCSSTSRRIAY